MDLKEFLEENDYDIEDCITALRVDEGELLEIISDYKIEDYAKEWLEMLNEDELPPPDLYHFSISELWEHILSMKGIYSGMMFSIDDSVRYLQDLHKVEVIHGYFTFLDKFEEFKQTF